MFRCGPVGPRGWLFCCQVYSLNVCCVRDAATCGCSLTRNRLQRNRKLGGHFLPMGLFGPSKKWAGNGPLCPIASGAYATHARTHVDPLTLVKNVIPHSRLREIDGHPRRMRVGQTQRSTCSDKMCGTAVQSGQLVYKSVHDSGSLIATACFHACNSMLHQNIPKSTPAGASPQTDPIGALPSPQLPWLYLEEGPTKRQQKEEGGGAVLFQL